MCSIEIKNMGLLCSRNRHFRGVEAEENAHRMQKLKGELRKKQKLKSISRNFYYLLPWKRKEENHEEI
ncbi:hypothetical protein I3842_04G067100 [Carya illinoinensis]|uniref:Uncharacterized protein n=1 Tax=Carya illinoinensis TaxID=32201 RepID=A0A922F695_CARIL|nr:hypothetical protein I3842_04G067100 [Carya illinoinensis]